MASRSKMEFKSSGHTLAGLLETPDGPVQAYVLFAHCFTCGKDITSASRISRGLVARGFAVLRFDFTGLGNSDGDFANTNFSSNVQDLIAAANHLKTHYEAPKLLIGHSLGGTAILKAAADIAESVGVITIGAPFTAAHVAKQLKVDRAALERDGTAQTELAGRKFTIKKQFMEDIAAQDADHLGKLGKALLVLHAPLDRVVSIDEAEKIYRGAKHPKSFISLDTADHLLSQKADAEYVANIISAWAGRFVNKSETQNTSPVVSSGQVLVGERDHKFACDIFTDSHTWLADEPIAMGGLNSGPDPYEHLLAALGGCTSMTVRMYANRKDWPLEDMTVLLSHERKHGEDCMECDEKHPKIDLIKRELSFEGPLSQDQKQKLMEIANKCPVHRTLENKIVIETSAT